MLIFKKEKYIKKIFIVIYFIDNELCKNSFFMENKKLKILISGKFRPVEKWDKVQVHLLTQNF